MTNIHDVARQAGVSISTVSLALNGSPLVKEETRRHVQQVVKELGYVPNNGARSLRQGRTHSLGVIYMSETEEDMFYADYNDDHTAGLSSMSIVNGIMQSIMGSQYGVVSEHYCARSGSLPHIIESQRVDGVFLVASPYSRPFIETLQSIGLPFVVVGVDCQAPGVDSFWAESAAGITLALRHLAETGHKNVCLVNCTDVFGSSHSRHDAFVATARQCGLTLSPDWEIIAPTNCGRSSYEAFRRYWEAGNRPDSIIAGNGYLGLGVLRFLYEQDIRIPRDVSLITGEDSVLSGYAVPHLTSINIGKEELGRRAAEALIARIHDPDRPPVWYTQPPRLVCRASVLDRNHLESR